MARRSSYVRVALAAKNTDTREHDIADSDDYFQFHGAMVRTRSLTEETTVRTRGRCPASWSG